ncbi:Z1 domain-containing protein [Coprococcus catus]|uniref:Z1 domain-containing protein n=1 Tax=Coprococcus catus TaxID=116085 RepID=UPI002096A4C6|nr:Z1 domain-containing protein [Coprococcus catus]MCO7148034.1 Z1 domain-containing protein [Coprococcus catus]
MADLVLFEKFVRTQIGSVAVNRAPTEEELRDACAMIRRMMPVSDEDVELIIKKLQAALDVAMDAGIVIEKEYEPWLAAKKRNDPNLKFYYWDRYALYLEQDLQRTSGVISTIDKVSDKIVDLAGDPTLPGILKRKGLLLGDIQSGKTANYIAVMNKAADVGYKVIILLTGTIESLRRQTQERVDEGFIGRSSKAYLQRNSKTIIKGVGCKDSRRFATGFTTESSDFKTAVVRGMNASLRNMTTEPIVFVMKKNARALQNLIDWLIDYNTNNQGVIDLPLLLIDDEADNASINTREENDPTTINKHIRKLLSLFVKSSYVAVTATPFANIFILPDKSEDMVSDDLFPSDYIYALDPPTNYIGSNEIFGDNAQYVNSLETIDDANEFFPYKHKQSIILKGLPESLYTALRYFLLVNVVRDIQGEPTTHRSMMVNVSRFVRVQEQINNLITEWLYEVKRDVRNYCMRPEIEACKNENILELRKMWNNSEYCFKDYGISWIDVQQKYLLKAISAIEVRTINQRSASKLDYTEYAETGLRVIAVGGLSLSRGLTLEGLVVSYFHRNTQMYDTLMQMGRWFGYRTGYENLFKIWMPDDSIGWYSHITQASNELREEIAKMNRLGATPKDFGLKVRAHPTSLIITARNKMKHAERQACWITLDGKFFETPRFKTEIGSIRENKERTDRLIKKIIAECGQPIGSRNQPLFWKSVPKELICEYVRTYDNHYLNTEADGAALEDYIKKNPHFDTWDVLIFDSHAGKEYLVENLIIHPSQRPFSRKSGVLSVYGGKMRIGTIGLTKHGLSEKDAAAAEQAFRELKREDYELKFKDQAEEKLRRLSIPDRAYLIPERNPILIIHYMWPEFKESKDIPAGFVEGQDLMVGYGMGFPSLAGSEPVYAVYYVNAVADRLKKDFGDEIEEDQLDDNED